MKKIILFILITLSCFNIIFQKISLMIFKISLINLIVSIIAIYYLLLYINMVYKNKFLNFMELFYLLYLIYGIIKLLYSVEMGENAISAYVRLFIFICLIYINKYMNIGNKTVRSIIKYFIIISIFYSIFGVSQFILSEKMPDSLLSYGLDKSKINKYYFYNSIIVRANGMFGNPIEYSSFLIICLIFISYYKDLVFSKYKYYFLYVIIILIGCLASLSRFAIFMSLLISLYDYIDYIKIEIKKKNKSKLLFNITLMITIIFLMVNFMNHNNIIFAGIDRLTGNTEESKQSTNTRIDFLKNYFKYYNQKPILGNKLGVLLSGNNIIPIYDGLYLNMIYDEGMLGLIVYLIIINYSILKIKNKKYSLLLLIYFGLSTILNSSMLHVGIAFIFYFSIGMMKNKTIV